MSKRIGTQVNSNPPPWKHKRTEGRRQDAEERQKLYDALTPQQKIARLDKEGHSAEKQRKRILNGL